MNPANNENKRLPLIRYVILSGLYLLQTCRGNNVPDHQGKLFVFTYTGSRIRPAIYFRSLVLIGTFEPGNIKVQLTCKRYCGTIPDGQVIKNFNVQYGHVQSCKINHTRFEAPKNPYPIDSYNQTVFVVSSIKRIIVFVEDVINLASLDATIIYPYNSANTEFVAIVPSFQKSFLQLISLKTKAKVHVKPISRHYKTNPTNNIEGHARYYYGCTDKNGTCADREYPENSEVTSDRHINYDSGTFYNLKPYHIVTLASLEGCCDFTGTTIISDNPINVVVGADEQYYYNLSSLDVVFDSIYSLKSAGKSVIVTINTIEEEKAIIKGLNVGKKSNIKYQIGSQSPVSITLEKFGDWFDYNSNGSQVIYLSASEPFLVSYLVYYFAKLGGPCFTIILPIELWSNQYIWIDIMLIENSVFYTNFIIRSHLTGGLIVDNSQINDWKNFTKLFALVTNWSYTTTKSNIHGYHLAYHRDVGETFYLRLYVYSVNSGYCTVPGIVLREVNIICHATKTIAGDNTDNDCDGSFDEESADGIDNDNDGSIDEDLAPEDRVDGGWSNWEKRGECISSCGTTAGRINQVSRTCTNPAPSKGGKPCEGQSIKKSGDICTVPYVKCSYECRDNTYGYNCSRHCNNCALPCDPETGSCSKCKDGYRPPFCNSTCSNINCLKCFSNGSCFHCTTGHKHPPDCEPCEENKFGENCKEECSVLCSKCNSSNGDCEQCISGKKGRMCKENCTQYSYGMNCSKRCDTYCKVDCHKVTGYCPLCKPGLIPPFCNSSCDDEHCSICNNNGSCFKCKLGYFNDIKCEKCPRNKFGEDCKEECGPLCSKCEAMAGNCTECIPGFVPPACTDKCLHENCSICNSMGACVKCVVGHVHSLNCEPCSNKTFGDGCKRTCPKNCDMCNSVTGSCSLCQHGHWGEKCQRECKHCTICNKETGFCPAKSTQDFKSNSLLNTPVVASFLFILLLSVLAAFMLACRSKSDQESAKTTINVEDHLTELASARTTTKQGTMSKIKSESQSSQESSYTSKTGNTSSTTTKTYTTVSKKN